MYVEKSLLLNGWHLIEKFNCFVPNKSLLFSGRKKRKSCKKKKKGYLNSNWYVNENFIPFSSGCNYEPHFLSSNVQNTDKMFALCVWALNSFLGVGMINNFSLILKGTCSSHKVKNNNTEPLIFHHHYIFWIRFKNCLRNVTSPNINPHLYGGKHGVIVYLVLGRDFRKISQFLCAQIKRQLAGWSIS